MGDETIQIASRFSNAVTQLSLLAGDDTHADLRRTHGAGLPERVREALDAVQTVYQAGTQAVRDWPEQSRRVLAQLARMRELLDRSGVDEEVRGMARALVEAIERRTPRR